MAVIYNILPMFKTPSCLRKDSDTKNINSFQMNFKEVKAVDGKLKIKGFASTPDLDRYDDVIKPEAFANAMKTYMKNPIVLLGHDSNKPIGTVTEYSLDAKGLEVTVKLVNNTDDCFEKIQNKTLRGFSIGWICNDCIFREEGTKFIREVTALDLVEISVVATPANPSTLFTLSKSLKKMFDKMAMEKKDVESGEVIPVSDTPSEETPVETPEETPESETPTEESKETDIETPEVETPQTVETPEVETPEEIPTEDVPPDTSTIVKADEEPEVATEEATEEEVKALMESIVAEAVSKAVTPLIAQNMELKATLEQLQTQVKAVEDDICKIEVLPSRHSEKKSFKGVLTYSMV